tara:strand:- start:6058 stop:7731 length:1674 start_codon:yes stop_codon:yes gene_type:complete
MSWKKHFTRYNVGGGTSAGNTKTNRWQSWLPEVYSGQPNRIERYTQYDQMDQDSEINAALDTIAEFSTQTDAESKLPFKIEYKTEPTDSEVNAIETTLKQWIRINDFERRMFTMFRSCIKYGDQFFIRDPETYKLIWVQPGDVAKSIVNESEGRKIDQYIVKNIALNLQDLVATDTKKHTDSTTINPTTGYSVGKGNAGIVTANNSSSMSSEFAVDSKHMVHVSLSDGMNNNWPFGNSILEAVFKVYKQKELLEDSIIIYRVQRAPERRVFYIDVGNMPAHKAMGFVERVKNEVHQTRIPNMSGGGTKVVDAAYNPLSIMEDYFFAQTAEGRGSKVEVLPGGENLGEIDDLKYFNNKLMRGLRVPTSYLPTGSEDGIAAFNDGRVGTAMIQEFRFAKYCERLQATLQNSLDREFKLFCKHRGLDVSASLFDLNFVEPQSFSQYRTIEIDAQRAQLFGQLEGVPYLSRRFLLDRYLGLTEEERVANERLWKEENQAGNQPASSATGDLGGLGIRNSDVESFEPTDVDAENAEPGDDAGGADVDTPDLNDDGIGTGDEI